MTLSQSQWQRFVAALKTRKDPGLLERLLGGGVDERQALTALSRAPGA